MILAGGLGTRLRPLTSEVPKPMLLIHGKPILWHIISHLYNHGYRDIIINVCYLKDVIINYVENELDIPVNITFLEENDVSGSAGAINKARLFFDSTFLVINGDIMTDIDLTELRQFHLSNSSLATLALYEQNDVTQFGVVVRSEHKSIMGFQEKPEQGTELSHVINAGIYIFDYSIFHYIPQRTGVVDLAKDVFPSLLSEKFYGLEFDPNLYRWRDIGNIKEYEEANK